MKFLDKRDELITNFLISHKIEFLAFSELVSLVKVSAEYNQKLFVHWICDSSSQGGGAKIYVIDIIR